MSENRAMVVYCTVYITHWKEYGFEKFFKKSFLQSVKKGVSSYNCTQFIHKIVGEPELIIKQQYEATCTCNGKLLNCYSYIIESFSWPFMPSGLTSTASTMTSLLCTYFVYTRGSNLVMYVYSTLAL